MATQTATLTTTNTPSLFESAPFIPADAIFALTAQYNVDSFPKKVNLGQGAYRDEHAQPWILPSVQKARDLLAQEKLNHEYLPILGHAGFRKAAPRTALGSDLFGRVENRVAACQSISGTGALHLAALLLKYLRQPLPNVYIPSPTWSNHHQVFASLGFNCRTFQYYDDAKKALDIDSYISALQTAEPHSIVIIHACAHNPTGCDPNKEQWKQIGRIVKEKQLFPLFDAAYLGFNSGNLDDDAFAIRYFVDELQLEVGVCMSFAKNMGLYGERVGCVFVVTQTETTATNTQSVLEMLQRSEVSNPPAYGAKIASTILNDDALRAMWYEDLITMSSRIRAMRTSLYDHLNQSGAPGTWDHLVQQSGMFGFLGLEPDVVRRLREDYHIYMAGNSRISIAGLNLGNVQYVAESISECLRTSGSN
ncbi:aromatic-amino-acid aminotransferase [Aspergillus affinis]|uniref:aromatic-amino-acid aminotransferase n=1 Tax=Aspergillus affinis TaxID=1070780 RepID=UPI0022FDD376|nr:aromatic-amino-acid aminotransferase [Aspergillus affinis]KAI9040663.1 aromatic-amino-acid aminotransferase [Aspergillus affinis]